MVIKPFRALRPREDVASRIPSWPYDVLDSDEARRLAHGDPHTFLHVEKPEIDLDPGIDPHDELVYAKGRENLQAMIDAGWLARDDKPAFYLYRLAAGDHEQTGIACVASVEDYLTDRIRKHEHTRPDKELDRTRHIDVVGADAGPILMAYRGVPEINAIVTGATDREPAASFTAADGIGHSLWVVDDPAACQQIEAIFAKIPRTYIADGHHRAAAAARIARERRDKNPGRTGDESYNFFLAVHFPAKQLRVLGYHRLVKDLNGLEPEAFVDRLRAAGFDVKRPHRTKRPTRRGTFSMCLASEWSLLTPGAQIEATGDPVADLDVSVLDRHVLKPILGIGDPRTDQRIAFVGGGRGVEELERLVAAGECAVSFALYPTAIDDVMRVADSGSVLPPKSTWFDPKLRSGMVVHVLD